ncbi:hypothetical protein UlMin_045521 [Ulmus minor]
MGINNYKGLIGWLIVVCLAEVVASVTYEVGDSTGWTIPSSTDFYSEWAESKTFHVGDELSFNWSGSHDVAEVSEREYENCTKTSNVFGSPLTINLTSTGNHYFICTVDTHCERGQKLAVDVSYSNYFPPGSSSSPASSTATGALLVVISTIVMYI